MAVGAWLSGHLMICVVVVHVPQSVAFFPAAIWTTLFAATAGVAAAT